MWFDLKQVESIAEIIIKNAPKEKLLEGLEIIKNILQKIEKRIKEENENGKN